MKTGKFSLAFKPRKWLVVFMPKRSSKKKDINQIAASIVAQVTGEAQREPTPEKNPAAVALGRLGGLKGGKARAASLSAEKRKEIATRAAISRWNVKKNQ